MNANKKEDFTLLASSWLNRNLLDDGLNQVLKKKPRQLPVYVENLLLLKKPSQFNNPTLASPGPKYKNCLLVSLVAKRV